MNSRKLILNFTKGLGNLEMMTWCLLGKRYQNPLIDALSGTDNLFIYHQKGERVFQKSYSQKELEGSILEIAFDYNEPLKLSKEDFVYDIIDPFYKKSMTELSFSSVIVLPIHHEGKTIAVVLIYSEENLSLSDFLEKDFKVLIDELIAEEEKETLLSFNEKLIKELDLPYIIKKNNQIIYISPTVKKIGNDKLNANYQKEVKVINELEIILYNELNSSQQNSIYIINDLSEENTLSLIAVKQKSRNRRFEDFSDQLKQDIEKVFTEQASFYKYDDNTIIVGFSQTINKRVYNQFKKAYSEYLVNLVRVTKEIPNNQNLVKIASYLVENINENFEYNNYLSYRKKQEEESYYESLILESKAKLVFHPIENSKNGDIFGYFPYFNFQNLELFGHRIFNYDLSLAYNLKLLSALLKFKSWPGIVMITLLGKQLLNDEIIDFVNKLNQKAEHKIAIHLANVGDISHDILIKLIKKLKKKDFLLYASEDLFASFNLFELMDYFNGIIIDNPLLNRVRSGDYDLVTIVINYYLQRYKLVIFRDLAPEDKGAITPHQNVYWKK